jgi:hypothetical protein
MSDDSIFDIPEFEEWQEGGLADPLGNDAAPPVPPEANLPPLPPALPTTPTPLPHVVHPADLYEAARQRALADHELSKLFNPDYYRRQSE